MNDLLLTVPLALLIGGIFALVDWSLSLPHRWSAEMEAYELRCLQRVEPVDEQAWLDALVCAARVAAARRYRGRLVMVVDGRAEVMQ